MRHVKQIHTIIDQGHYAEAHEALDNLLSLGPNNTEALKLKSILFAQEGRFSDEAKMWEKVLTLDNEDVDALYFFQRRHFEERENFYFTDSLPDGGRRFLAHPRAIINASLAGLLGCLVFLLLSSYANKYMVLASTLVSFSSFSLLVLLPWLFIVVAYFRSLREVLVTQEGLIVATRLHRHILRWEDIKQVSLAHTATPQRQTLSMVFEPLDSEAEVFEIDLARESTPLRARSCFIAEICRLFREPQYVERSHLDLAERRLISF